MNTEQDFQKVLQDHDNMMKSTDQDMYVLPILMDGYKDKRTLNVFMCKAKMNAIKTAHVGKVFCYFLAGYMALNLVGMWLSR